MMLFLLGLLYMSDGSPWWWATNRKNKRALTSMLELYWIINRFDMLFEFSLYHATKALKIICLFYAMFCRHRACYLTDTMNPGMSHLSLTAVEGKNESDCGLLLKALSRCQSCLMMGVFWRGVDLFQVSWKLGNVTFSNFNFVIA